MQWIERGHCASPELLQHAVEFDWGQLRGPSRPSYELAAGESEAQSREAGAVARLTQASRLHTQPDRLWARTQAAVDLRQAVLFAVTGVEHPRPGPEESTAFVLVRHAELDRVAVARLRPVAGHDAEHELDAAHVRLDPRGRGPPGRDAQYRQGVGPCCDLDATDRIR